MATFDPIFQLPHSALVPGGEDIPFTEENLKAYTQAVVDFYLDENTQQEYLAIEEGFKAAANCDWLTLVEPQYPRLAFCGLQAIDWLLLCVSKVM